MNTSEAALTKSKVGNDVETLQSASRAGDETERECDLSESRKAVRDLWDEQTLSEMNESELARFASAKRLIRKQQFARAKAVLQAPYPTCAESLNVLGTIHEALKDFDSARNCYGQARSIDKNCLAARLNGQRLYELHAFGRSTIPVYL